MKTLRQQRNDLRAQLSSAERDRDAWKAKAEAAIAESNRVSCNAEAILDERDEAVKALEAVKYGISEYTRQSMLPRAFARHELDTWCQGGGYGELVYIKIDRALLASAFDVFEAAAPEPYGVPDPDWYVGVTHAGMPPAKDGDPGDPEVAAVLKAGDAFVVVMGLRDCALPPAVFP